MKKLYALCLVVVMIATQSLAQNKSTISQKTTSINTTITDPGGGTDPGISSEVGVTGGQLDISLTGSATYSVPIVVPPGINGVEPKLGLVYNSNGGLGAAGYGWNVMGLSAITRVPSTKFHDGINDPVNFNTNDRFALDGQRLILKTGTYGEIGSTYGTENFSNVKVTLTGNYGYTYSVENGVTIQIKCNLIFKVEYPDGSVAYYGNSTDSNTFAISGLTSWENAQGIKINYSYTNTNNYLYVTSIKYGGAQGASPINEVQFVYMNRTNPERYFQKYEIINDKIVKEIKVLGNGIGYRNYALSFDTTSGYDQLIKIQEKSGDTLKLLNPITFSYNEIATTAKFNFVAPNTSTDTAYDLINYNSGLFSGLINNRYRRANFRGNGDTDFLFFDYSYANYNANQNATQIYCNLNLIDFDKQTRKPFQLTVNVPNPSNYISPLCQVLKPIKFGLPGSGTNDYKISDKDGLLWLQSYIYNDGVTNLVKMEANVFSDSGNDKIDHSEYVKSFDLPNDPNTSTSCIITDINTNYNSQYTKQLYGDFNGDGLTDIIICRQQEGTNGVAPYTTIKRQFTNTYFVDLDRRKTANFVKDLGILYQLIGDFDPLYLDITTADVNKDNKTDIIVFIPAINKIKVLTLDENDNLKLLSETDVDLQYYSTHYIVNMYSLGDFNGDGNVDILLPYIDKILYGDGNNKFVVEQPNLDLRGGIANDFDGDGKTDIFKINHTSPNDGNMTLQLYNLKQGNLWVNTYTNSYSNVGGHFDLLAMHDSENLGGKAEMIFISTFCRLPLPSQSSPSNPCNYSYRVSYIRFNNNFQNQKLLNTIQNNGKVESITYSSLVNGNGAYTKSALIENYPNCDLPTLTGFKIVSQVDVVSVSMNKTQQFKYYGGVSNMEGLGFLGFRGVTRTNWFNNPAQITTTATKLDMSKRGAPIESFTMLGQIAPNYNFTAGDAFINRSLITYNNEDTGYINPLLADKSYKLYKTKGIIYNGLENTSSETTTQYNANNSPLVVTQTIKNNGAVEKTSTTSLTYDAPVTSPYMVDRLLSKNSSVTAGSDTMISEELYTIYDANLLKQIKKKGTGTNYITEDNEYDVYGNITKKTLTATGLPARISSFEYDATTHRFVTKKTDIEGLQTVYTYNLNTGDVLTETLPSNSGVPLKTTFVYDVWGKLTKKTDYLGKNETYTYANVIDGGMIKTALHDDSSSNKITLDEFGREVQKQVLNIDGSWSVVDTQYDINDRVIFKTTPYIGSQTAWNEIQYDVYGRVSQSTVGKTYSSSGKTTTYSYSGLTVTENDGFKTKTTVNNALSKPISVTETPGGPITYTYFANGNLKSTIYSGATISIQQDGWGRKTGLSDPSAGDRTYVYNDFGELTKETIVGKGTIEYSLNPVGKPDLVTIKDAANVVTGTKTYTYDATTKLLNKLRFDDTANSTFTEYNYTYDTYKRLSVTDENTDLRAQFTKTIYFDGFGRTSAESYYALNKIDNKSSNKIIDYNYKNGALWQILDDDTYDILWQTNTVNAQGQLKTGAYGNGIAVTNTYDELSFPTQNKHMKGSTNVMTLTNVFDQVRGNLTSRTNSMFANWNETLTYDSLDRLTGFKDINGSQTQSYNDNGTIAGNRQGTHAYQISGKPFQVSSITPANQNLSQDVLLYYNNRPQTITYNIYKDPVTINEGGVETIDFEYNAFDNRTAMYYGGTQATKAARPYRKYYSADGAMEIKIKTSAPASVEFVTYIGGDAYDAPVLLKSDGTTQNYYYLHRDYQGTIAAITDATGTVVEKRLFDVWGGLIQYANNSGVSTVPTTTASMFLDRGYTGHEHLLGVNLINMNGRIYDFRLHRFLQPDNNIQSPYNTQNYNRYGYCMNNPTKYTDQSGEFWGWLAGFIFSTYIHGGQATGNPNPLQWNGGDYLNAASAAGSTTISTFVTDGVNNYISNYGHPNETQMQYIKDHPVQDLVESHGYVKNSESSLTKQADEDFILYNGTELIWIRDGSEFKRFPATSGHVGFQNSKFQDKKDDGPLPEGSYTINLSLNPNRKVKFSKEGDVLKGDGIQKIPSTRTADDGFEYSYEDWGTMRARLNADPAFVKAYGRDDFYIHNSHKGYSSGCIESGYNNLFFNMLIDYGKSHPSISVIVDYPNLNSSTYGNTKR